MQNRAPLPSLGVGQPCIFSVEDDWSFFNVFLAYVDDSGDEKVRCFSALLIHESAWRASRMRLLDFRRALK